MLKYFYHKTSLPYSSDIGNFVGVLITEIMDRMEVGS